jgi:hypothetical protein
VSLSRAQFAARLAQMTAFVAAWNRDALTPLTDQLNKPERTAAVERFIKEMRQRLKDLEWELNS